MQGKAAASSEGVDVVRCVKPQKFQKKKKKKREERLKKVWRDKIMSNFWKKRS